MPGPLYFAWVGGDIKPQTVVQTTGDIHGGVAPTIATTASITSGSTAAALDSITGLVLGQLYGISAAGIPTGALFIYEGTTAITLSAAATATATGVTVTIEEPQTLELTTIQLNSSSTATNLGQTNGLVSGSYYSIRGAAIPSGTIFLYSGGTTITLLSDFLGTLAVATETLLVDVTIAGKDVAASSEVTNIPGLAALEPAAQYDIAGAGIPVGATFIAPPSGTTITLDLAPTKTAINVPLVITGPRTPNAAAFDQVLDTVDDEQIFAIDLSQAEGGFATLKIEIQNPALGLLGVGRQIWCWLSWDDGTGTIVPLFNGRLVGIPARQNLETAELQFVAQPDDFSNQKEAVASALRVLPFWDPVWLAAKVDDPDTVLEGYSKLWHIDRVTLAVTASDILEGEDGTVEIQESDHFYDEMELSYGQPPLTEIAITGTVTYTQQGDGVVDLTRKIWRLFADGGSPYAYPVISSLTGDGLKSAWPAASRSIGEGWSVTSDTDPDAPTSIAVADHVHKYNYEATYSAQLTDTGTVASKAASSVVNPWTDLTVDFPLGAYTIALGVAYSANRKRTEEVSFTMVGDLQKVLAEPAGADREQLSLTSSYVDQAVDTGGALPIGDLRLNSYFKTARGASSFEYLLMLGRARLRSRARAVHIKFGVPWAIAVPLTLRNSVTLYDRRLPGGSVTGKIIDYQLLVSDKDGARGNFTIGCTVGHGTAVAPAVGINSWAEDGYVENGYQLMANSQVLSQSADIGYETFDDFEVVDDGLDLTNMTADEVVDTLTLDGTLKAQVDAINAYKFGAATITPIGALKKLPSVVTLDLKPVTSDFSTTFLPALTLLSLPKTIDLEAA